MVAVSIHSKIVGLQEHTTLSRVNHVAGFDISNAPPKPEERLPGIKRREKEERRKCGML